MTDKSVSQLDAATSVADEDLLLLSVYSESYISKHITFANFKAALSSKATKGFENLKLSATGTNANVSVTANKIMVTNASDLGAVLSSVSLTIATTASGANGLDTGSAAYSTWYSVWVIYNGSSVAGLLSTSATSPTLPTGYTYKARVGWIRTQSATNYYPLSFIQYGRTAQYKVAAGSNVTNAPIMISGSSGSVTTPTWTEQSVTNYVPTTAMAIRLVLFVPSPTAAMAAPNNAYGAYTSTSNPPPLVGRPYSGNYVVNITGLFILESRNVYYASNCSTAGLACLGWEDNL